MLSFSEGFDYVFEFNLYPNKSFNKKMKFVLANILGVAKGANALCSIFRNKIESHIVREWNILTDSCDNFHHKCVFYRQKFLKKLFILELKKLSFLKDDLRNSFFTWTLVLISMELMVISFLILFIWSINAHQNVCPRFHCKINIKFSINIRQVCYYW